MVCILSFMLQKHLGVTGRMMIDIWEWRKGKGLSDRHESMESYKQGFEKTLVYGMSYAEEHNPEELRASCFRSAEDLLNETEVVIYDDNDKYY